MKKLICIVLVAGCALAHAAKYLMSVYRDKLPNEGYAYYGLYYASQGLFQIGGENWKEFSDWMYAEYLPRQRDETVDE